MKKTLICALLGLGLATPLLQAQTAAPAGRAPVPAASDNKNTAAFTAQMFYQLLMAELSAANGDVGSAVSLLLDAARKTGDAQVYQRAADLALGARAGESALQVARSWRQAQPRSLEANRYVLQILLALNRVAETGEPLKSVLELTPAEERNQLLNLVPVLYGRASDKKLAATVAEQAMASALADPKTAATAWAAAARLRAGAGDTASALDAVRRAQVINPRSEAAAQVAIELMSPSAPQAELVVKKYLEGPGQVAPEVRFAYARNLMESQRLTESETQLLALTREQPEFADGWLLLGSLQMDTPRLQQADASLRRYVELAEKQNPRNARGLAQAALMLAQVAEKRGDFAAAEGWLKQINSVDLVLQTQTRRASLLARQGKMAEARELIRQLPEREAGDARAKLLAEVNLLREFKQYQPASELLAQAIKASPQDVDLLYEQAMMAEKLNRMDQMEQLLRRVMQAKPDYHAAYNALGYSLADRGVRLQEARQLIQKALEFAPNDPFIQDSLAWVEFRLGNKAEALRIIEAAYKARPDAEIAAHFGEILWSLGQRDRAQAIWREGLQINPDNETLQDTLKRLRAKP